MAKEQCTKPSNEKKPMLSTINAVWLSIISPVKRYFSKTESESFEFEMIKAASALNKSCPIMVDSETRLDNSVALSSNVFQYNYTMINYLKEDLNIDYLRDNIEPGIINNVKTNPDLVAYREHNVTMAYYYRDKNGVFLFRVLVEPNQYQ